jgi:3-hydroxypropanoate dehydrogenase
MTPSTEQLFTQGRTPGGFLATPVPDSTLQALYELAKWGPTSLNCNPARFVFVRTPEARQQLAACVSPGNKARVLTAPVTVIVGMDMDFAEQLPALFPHMDGRTLFAGKPALTEATAFRNSSLQGAYLMLAARSLGLDCGPMSGFDNALVDAAFFAATAVRSNFICVLGHADPAAQRPRLPRLAFDVACRLA